MKDKWISIEDSLPEQEYGYARSKLVLVYSKYHESMRLDYCMYIENNDVGFSSDVTHWQPLPPKPEGK